MKRRLIRATLKKSIEAFCPDFTVAFSLTTLKHTHTHTQYRRFARCQQVNTQSLTGKQTNTYTLTLHQQILIKPCFLTNSASPDRFSFKSLWLIPFSLLHEWKIKIYPWLLNKKVLLVKISSLKNGVGTMRSLSQRIRKHYLIDKMGTMHWLRKLSLVFLISKQNNL